MKQPPMWQMVKEATENLNGRFSYSDIIKYINSKWAGQKISAIYPQIYAITVNLHSRIHYLTNPEPRLTNSNSDLDLLFNTGKGKGEVEKYNPDKHGIWEIYYDEDNRLSVRQFSEGIVKKIFTPSDIIWFKNVTDTINGEAYLQSTENSFIIHFPTKHKTNALSPAVDELILIYQKINGVAAFTHIVTPVDDILIEDKITANYAYGRRVKIVAKTDKDNFIPVSSTLWNRLKFSGITQGNACKLENISNIGNIDELQFDIWQRFTEHFIPSEQQSVITTSAIINELQISNPDLSVSEGQQRLVSHLVKERNRKIINEKKRQAIISNTLQCKVCNFSFEQTYQANFIECHHLSPISGAAGVRETKLEDLALVCANCHRMLHTKFDGQFLSIQELQARVESLKKV